MPATTTAHSSPCGPRGSSPDGARWSWPFRLWQPAESFDLATTLESGQVFHWELQPDGSWRGLLGNEPCLLRRKGDELLTTSPPECVRAYFRLDDPLEEILATFPPWPYARAAMLSCRGLRLIRQPFWECLATFLCSSMKQVTHIRQITRGLRERFGTPVADPWADADAAPLWTFPKPEVVAELSEKTLRSCGLGYRAKALQATAAKVAAGEVEEARLRELPTNEARALLQTLPGVGPKIAHCVLLFSLERLEAVPVDVWIARVLDAQAGRKLTPRQRESRARRLGPYAGYVQQYLFHHARAHRHLPNSLQ